MPEPLLRLKPLSPRATLPAYQTDLAAGLDLAACLSQNEEDDGGITITPVSRGGGPVLIRCGFAMAIPPGYEAQVRPRSGLAGKLGVTMPNAPGTIDADYRGEVMVPLINLGPEPYTVKHGARIAQMVIAPISRATIRVVDDLEETARGHGGFGSTGGH